MDEGLRRPLIFFAVFSMFFALIISQVPALILYSGKTYQDPSYKTEWQPLATWMNITAYDNGTVTRPAWPLGNTILLDLEPYGIVVAVLWSSLDPDNLCFSRRDYYFGPFFHSVDIEPYPVTKTYAESQLEGNVSIFNMKDDVRTYYVQFYYDDESYGNLTEAWDGGELYVWVGLGWEQMPTTVNVWSFISGFLTFQAPLIHPSIDPYIAIAFWVGIGVTAIIFLSRLIPFIRGA